MLDMLKRVVDTCADPSLYHKIGHDLAEMLPEIRVLIQRAEGGDDE